LQCPAPRTFEQRREETPAEALWLLAERFDLEQNPQAAERTRQFLLQRYPSTRFAHRARAMTEQVEATADAGPSGHE
jgi:hypothetical protein